MENNFIGLEYVLLFKGGRRVLKQLQNTIGNKYKLSNIVVKVCKLLLHLTGKKQTKRFSNESRYMKIKRFENVPLDRLVTNFRRFGCAC
jgi:hypothetical protein